MRLPTPHFRLPIRKIVTVAFCALATPLAAQQGAWTGAVFGGVLTSNDFEEVFQPNQIDFVDSQIAGVILGYELRLPDDRWTLGAELQVVKHFGIQTHTEINVPVVLRYHPRNPWPRPLESVAFGIGGSHATALPQVEINNDGATRRNLIYWLFEVEFTTPQPSDTVFLRLHHRSDAFGLLDPPAGSNAVVFGLRRAF